VGNAPPLPPGPQATISFTLDVPDNVVNPVFPPSSYGFANETSAPTVSFGGFFDGQSLNTTDRLSVIGNPTSPVSLNASAPETFVAQSGIVFLQGTIGQGTGVGFGTGPIALLLSHPVSAIQVSVDTGAKPCSCFFHRRGCITQVGVQGRRPAGRARLARLQHLLTHQAV
jgi:hypothetical protein